MTNTNIPAEPDELTVVRCILLMKQGPEAAPKVKELFMASDPVTRLEIWDQAQKSADTPEPDHSVLFAIHKLVAFHVVDAATCENMTPEEVEKVRAYFARSATDKNAESKRFRDYANFLHRHGLSAF